MLGDVLARGYFPEELPPCFTTTNFAAVVMSNRATLPQAFTQPRLAQLCSFSLARAGNSRFRRRLSIVNPTNFFALADKVAANWATLDAHIGTSVLSRSKPVLRTNGTRALSPITYERRELIRFQAECRASARALLVADISEFYHSVYTHSIPWALSSKAFAKQNRGSGILGNDIDTIIRNSQHGQTMGIPIGPDTSLVIAECILAAVENLMRPHLSALVGFRFVDDFELCFKDHSSAEHALAVLQEQLLEFELRVNPRKTAIYVPPISFEPEWVGELRRFTIRNNSGESGDLVSYFDLMTRFLLAHPNEHVSKYGLKRMTRFTPRPKNVGLYTSLLCHIGVAEPGSIREVVQSVLYLRSQGIALDLSAIEQALNTVIRNSAPLGHHYEVAWCLWCLLSLGVPLDSTAIAALSGENSVVAILVLDAHRRGLAPGLNTARWAARMTEQDLREDEWLLSYEANIQNWLPSVGGSDHVARDAAFGFLKSHKVQFYVP